MRHNNQNKWHKWLQCKMQPCSLTTASCPWVLPTMSSPLPFFGSPLSLEVFHLAMLLLYVWSASCFITASCVSVCDSPMVFCFFGPLLTVVSDFVSLCHVCLISFFFRRTAGFEEPQKESMQDNIPMIGKTLLTYVVSPLTYSTAV